MPLIHHMDWYDKAKKSAQENQFSLGIYVCPYCNGKAYNGDPKNNSRFKGSGECSECHKSFSIVGMKLQSVGTEYFPKVAMPLPKATNYPDEYQGSSLSYIRDKLSPEEAGKIENDHPDLGYIAHGNAGVAYTNQNPNTVIKLTRDGLEAERAKELIGKNLPCCVQIFDVQQSSNNVWKIVAEKVNPLTSLESRLIDYMYLIDYGHEEAYRFQQILDGYKDQNLVNKIAAEYEHLIQCLRQNGINDEDTAGQNLGRRGNQLVLLDVG